MNEFNILFQEPLPAEEIAQLLKTTPAALEHFEKAYQEQILDANYTDGGLFDLYAKQVRNLFKSGSNKTCDQSLIDQIVRELMTNTKKIVFRSGDDSCCHEMIQASTIKNPVTNESLKNLPLDTRPQLTGRLVKKDIGPMGYPLVLTMYKKAMTDDNEQSRRLAYHLFRQGLDVLDLDPVLYDMLGANPVSMGYWLPKIANAVQKHGFFKIPNTIIIKVPLPVLQLTRLDFNSLNQTTKTIVNQFCHQIFELDDNKEYFVKTGVFSSKFDFRNAHVHGASEVQTLGEYLLFITNQSVMMASPLAKPSIYGAATTNEWVVRDFIPDVENNPTIYKGLPLRVEYRIFADFDTKQILACCNYWDPDLLKQRFSQGSDKDSPHNKHDYVIIQMHEAHMQHQFDQTKDKISDEVQKLLFDSELKGQWAVDIMKNGDDYYLIDMSPAENSALYNHIPERLRKPSAPIDWLPTSL